MPFFELLVAGILLGGLYALMACGLNLVFGVMRVINFAHGDLMAVGALTTVSLVAGLHMPYAVALVAVPLLTAAIGLAMQWLVIRRINDGPMIMSLLATFALSTIVVNISILIWGGGFRGLKSNTLTETIGGRAESWVSDPSRFILLHEPPARIYGCVDSGPRWYQWHFSSAGPSELRRWRLPKPRMAAIADHCSTP